MPTIGFDHHQAHQALDEFLADGYNRWIAAADTPLEGRPQFAPHDVAAHIVSDEHLSELQRKADAYDELIEEKDFDGLPAGYRPFIHSPNASTDRLIPHEPFHTPLAHAMYSRPFAELEKVEADRVRFIAIEMTLRATFDPDSEGTVPILMWASGEREAESRKLWQMAYTTPVAGLYVRETGNNPFFPQFAVVVAGGYQMVAGFFSRDDATAFAVAVAKAIPAVDWLTLDQSGFTKEVAVKVREVWNSHGPMAAASA